MSTKNTGEGRDNPRDSVNTLKATVQAGARLTTVLRAEGRPPAASPTTPLRTPVFMPSFPWLPDTPAAIGVIQMSQKRSSASGLRGS